MRILVCGGRNYGHVVRTTGNPREEPPETQERIKENIFIQDSLGEIVNKVSVHYNPNNNWLPTDITIIHGGARGADSAAGVFAAVNFCQEEVYQADWKTNGKAAGFIRNKQMLVEGKPDLVVAFPGGKGTAMMVKLAKTAGVKVIEMGTLGTSSQTTGKAPPAFKTKQYEKMFLDRMTELKGFATPGQRDGIILELQKEEQDWLANMGTEYDEIMQAQDLMNEIKP